MHVSTPPPEAIFAAAVTAQVAFLAILGIGGILLHRAALRLRLVDYDYSQVGWIALLVGVGGLASIVFSDKPSGLWGSLLGVHSLSAWPLATGIAWALSLDLAYISYVVWLTGGSKHSAFKELYFFLPVLCIFLREPIAFTVSFCVAVAIIFSATLLLHRDVPDYPIYQDWMKLIYGLVTVLAFAATSFIGISLEYFR